MNPVCVKCGHSRDDPRRRGADEFNNFCIRGCGCLCAVFVNEAQELPERIWIRPKFRIDPLPSGGGIYHDEKPPDESIAYVREKLAAVVPPPQGLLSCAVDTPRVVKLIFQTPELAAQFASAPTASPSAGYREEVDAVNKAVAEIFTDHIAPCAACFGNALPDVQQACIQIIVRWLRVVRGAAEHSPACETKCGRTDCDCGAESLARRALTPPLPTQSAEHDHDPGVCPAPFCGHPCHWGERCPDCPCIGIPSGATQDGPWATAIAALPPHLRKLFPVEAQPERRHNKNCAAWTVTLDGKKQPCDCGAQPEQEGE